MTQKKSLAKYQTIKAGDIIVSTPHASNGMIFDKSVVLILSHDKFGTSGVIINKVLNNLKGKEILSSLNLTGIKRKAKEIYKDSDLPVCLGGPVEQDKGILIHSNDYKSKTRVKINSEIYVNTSVEIVEDILSGKGPEHKVMILGYASWEDGQLASEIKRNEWFVLPDFLKNNSMSFNLVFIEDYLYKWEHALSLVGASINNYSSFAGRA